MQSDSPSDESVERLVIHALVLLREQRLRAWPIGSGQVEESGDEHSHSRCIYRRGCAKNGQRGLTRTEAIKSSSSLVGSAKSSTAVAFFEFLFPADIFVGVRSELGLRRGR